MIKEMFDLNMRLASISRYSQTHLIMKESVLEHSGSVVLFCYLISISINREVDLGKLLSRAIVHDFDEISTGDIPHPTKYDNPHIEMEIKKVEAKNMIAISNEISGDDKLFNLWDEAKNDDIEGAILTIADSFSVVYKLWQETILYNNRTMVEHIISFERVLIRLRNRFSKKYGMELIFDEIDKIYREIKSNVS